MRIGILIKEFKKLKNWELRIIDEIRKDPDLTLALLVKDGRTHFRSTGNRFRRALKSGNLAGRVMFSIQAAIEAKLFRAKRIDNRLEIIAFLKEIDCISLRPVRRANLDIFSEEDTNEIRQFDLDVILRHAFKIIRGPILGASKQGIWSFHHGDNSVNRGGPPGFWEIMLKQPVIGVTLQQLTSVLDGGLVIDKGFYFRHWSLGINRVDISEGSVDLLMKNLRALKRGDLSVRKSEAYHYPLYRTPTPGIFFKYLFQFYFNASRRLWRKLLYGLLRVRFECWTLFIGKGEFAESTLYTLKPVPLPRGRFWADPFLFQYEGESYIFFENYVYSKDKAKISCGKILDGKITDIVDVLDLDTHLSYPFVFSEDGQIYMIPENSGTKRLEVYRCISFPDRWELYSTAFEGERMLDTTYYCDDSGKRWLFTTKGYSNHYSNLYIYQIDSLKMEIIRSHASNPVIIDARSARCAGPFFRYNGQLVRPSQNCSNGIYGFGLNLNVIKKLSLTEYEEEKIIATEPNFHRGLEATHHLHQNEDMYVIDASYKRKL